MTLVERIDTYQQSHRGLGVAWATVKKFSGDRGSALAVVISYYSFFSLFPLLMAFFTVVARFVAGDPDLQHRLTDSVITRFPVVGDDLTSQVGTVKGSGIALVIGLVTALWAGMGAVQVTQDAFNTIFDVPFLDRPKFVAKRVRSLLLLGVLGVGLVAVTAIGSLSGVVAAHLGSLGVVVQLGTSALANMLLLAAVFRTLTARPLPKSALLPASILGGVLWVVVQNLGSYYLVRVVGNASSTYGVFAAVIGILTWITLLAQITVISAAFGRVLEGNLYPRGLTATRPTAVDAEVEAIREVRELRSEVAPAAVADAREQVDER